MVTTLQLGFAHTATVDHVIPRSKGGKGRANKKLCCHLCNTQKGDKTVQQFQAELLTKEGQLQRLYLLGCNGWLQHPVNPERAEIAPTTGKNQSISP